MLKCSTCDSWGILKVCDVESDASYAAQVEGNGFLYKQVRHMVGAILTAGRGRLTPEAISAALELGSTRPPGAQSSDAWQICNFRTLHSPPIYTEVFILPFTSHAGNAYRGWNIANAQGLCLMRVDYPEELLRDSPSCELAAAAA